MRINQPTVIACLLALINQLTTGQTNPGTRADAVIQQLGMAFVREKAHVGLSIGLVCNGQTLLGAQCYLIKSLNPVV